MGRPKTYDREEVLRRAARLFADKGYEGAHLQELVEATGINRFSLYKEFGGKEGLFEAALGQYIEGLDPLRRALSKKPLGVGNVRAFFEMLVAFGFRNGCLAMNTIRDKHLVGRRAWKAVQGFATGAESLLRANLRASQERGEIGKATDVQALARLLTALDMGLLTYGILERSVTRRKEAVALLDRLLV